jgi:hypothetical protein
MIDVRDEESEDSKMSTLRLEFESGCGGKEKRRKAGGERALYIQGRRRHVPQDSA